MEKRIAILVPCYNEALTVVRVVEGFRRALPGAVVYVYDNNSTDDTAALAAGAGAVVRPAPRQGKGFVVQRMFQEVDADEYVIVDGDATYPPEHVERLLAPLRLGHDMVVGARLAQHENNAFRPLHHLGNRGFAGLVSALFGVRLTDILSGYRAMSRRFVKSVPLSAGGFGIETDMTLNALSKGFSIVEVTVPYAERPPGSFSKLNTWRDGVVILQAIAVLFKDYRPLWFFGSLSTVVAGLSLLAGSAPIRDYVLYANVMHVPLAVLAAALATVSVITMGIGLVLDTVSRYHREQFALFQRLLERE